MSKEKSGHDLTRFELVMDALQKWRQDDHEDNLVLHRSYVIDIIEGVRTLRSDE